MNFSPYIIDQFAMAFCIKLCNITDTVEHIICYFSKMASNTSKPYG